MIEHVEKMARWGGARFSRRIARSIPFVGALVALATIGSTMRRKGAFGGLADTGLNAIPYVGALKNVIEVVRREDFFPDLPAAKQPRTARARRH
jgi:hypothetical protein